MEPVQFPRDVKSVDAVIAALRRCLQSQSSSQGTAIDAESHLPPEDRMCFRGTTDLDTRGSAEGKPPEKAQGTLRKMFE